VESAGIVQLAVDALPPDFDPLLLKLVVLLVELDVLLLLLEIDVLLLLEIDVLASAAPGRAAAHASAAPIPIALRIRSLYDIWHSPSLAGAGSRAISPLERPLALRPRLTPGLPLSAELIYGVIGRPGPGPPGIG